MKRVWQTKKLVDLCRIRTGKKDVNNGNPDGKFPFFTCATEHTFSDSYSFDTEALLIAGNGDVGKVSYYKGKFEAYQRTYVLSDFTDILPRFLYLILDGKLKDAVSKQKLGNTMPYIRVGMLTDFQLPVPPLPDQQRIVGILDEAFKGIANAKVNAENNLRNARGIFKSYRENIFAHLGEDWKELKLGEVCKIKDNLTRDIDPALPYIGADSIESNTGKLLRKKLALDQGISGIVFLFDGKRLLYSKIRPYLNKLCVVDFKGYCSSDMYPLSFDDLISFEYASQYMLSKKFVDSLSGLYERASIPKINREQLFEVLISFPPLSEQQRITAKLDALSDETKKLESIYQKKLVALDDLKKSLLNQAFNGEL